VVNVRDARISTTSGGTAVVAKPDTQSKDLLVAFQFSRGQLDSMTAPGWAFTGADAHTELLGVHLATKVWTRTPGAETGYTFGQDSGTVIVASVQDWDPSRPLRIAIDPDSGATPGVTPAAAQSLELRVIACVPDVPTVWEEPAGYVLRARTTDPDAPVSSALASRQLSSSSPSGPKEFGGGGGFLVHGVTVSIAAGIVEPEIPPIPPDAPGQGDSVFSYRFSRLFGGPLGDLDLKGVQFGIRVNRRGQINAETFKASYDISNEDEGDLVAALVPRDPADLTRGAGVVVCDIWGAGIHWGRYWMIGNKISKTRRQRPALQLNGFTMDAYLQWVQLEETLPFTGEDRVEIARQLITHMQAQPHADIGLMLAPGSSGSTLTKTFEANQGMYGQHVAACTEGLDGFEHAIRTQLGAGGVELHWEWGKPLGDPDAPHEFSDSPHGGNLLDYSIEQTPLNYGTRFRARGDSISTDASTASVPLLSDPYESPHLATGLWPRIDRTIDRPGVTSKAELDAVAEQAAATSGGAPRVFSITVLLGQEPTFTPNHVGDSARLTITDEFFKRINGGAGLDTRVRTLGMRVTPVGRENGRAEAEIFIDDQPIE
jgi:hypothetical protein